MATTTQNLALIKPAGTDKIRISQINSNMDTIDAKMGAVGNTPLQTQATNAASSISALQSGMAIICNGNTHAAIASGSYAYVRNHSSLAEGLYQATTAIAANGALSTSNLTAVSGGGLNAVNQSVNSLNSKFSLQAIDITYESGITGSLFVRKKNESNPVITINGFVNFTNAPTTSGTLIATLPAGSRPGAPVRLTGALASAAYLAPAAFAYVIIDTNGTIKISPPSGNTLKSIYFSCAYHAQS